MKAYDAEWIKLLRKLLKLSQEEFAKKLRVSIETVRAWEQAKSPPSGPATVVMDLMLMGLSVDSPSREKLRDARAASDHKAPTSLVSALLVSSAALAE